MDDLRVLHVLNYGWPNVDGYTVRAAGMLGAQKQVLGYAPVVATSPYKVFAQGQDTGFIVDGWGPDNQVEAGDDATGRSLAALDWERPGIGLSPVTHRRFSAHLRDVCRRERIDIVHAHHPHYVGKAAMSAADAMEVPFVYEVRCFNGDYDLDRGQIYTTLRGHWQNYREYRLARRADAVVTIADGLAKRLTRTGVAPDNVFVVRNSVNAALFAPREARKPGDALRLGYATTFDRIENLDLLIDAAVEAARRLEKEGRNLELVIAGSGRDWDRIDTLVRQRGVGSIVQLLGFVPYSRMSEFYRELDLFVIARGHATVSLDTTPLKPLEAAGCAIPILSTDVPAMRELLREQSGARFAAPKVESLASGIVAFAHDPWQGDYDIAERTWSREVGKYCDVYARAFNTHARRSAKSGGVSA